MSEFASQAAEDAASEAGLSADEITGTGKDGAITKADVEAAADGDGAASDSPPSKNELQNGITLDGAFYQAGTPLKDLDLSKAQTSRLKRLGVIA